MHLLRSLANFSYQGSGFSDVKHSLDFSAFFPESNRKQSQTCLHNKSGIFALLDLFYT